MPFLNIFSKNKIKEAQKQIIIADNREKNSLVISELISLGNKVQFEQLQIGDYIIDNIAIERKTQSDLISSIIDKRIIPQLSNLKQYPEHLLILEQNNQQFNQKIDAPPYAKTGGLDGARFFDDRRADLERYGRHNINENALKGLMLSIALKFKVPIIYSQNEKDTAKYLNILANKKSKKGNLKSIRPNKKSFSDREQMQFILEGIPKIGPAKAKMLLSNFKNLKSIANASKEELKIVLGKQAEEIYNIFNQQF